MNKRDVLQRLDEIEAELFAQFRKVERLRLDLRREWNMTKTPEARERGMPLDGVSVRLERDGRVVVQEP